MLKIRSLSGGYANARIINELDLTVNRGEFFALLGPNGSGKTTLFKLITGQLAATSGEILLFDKNIKRLSKLERAKKMAVLAQETKVSFDYTVKEIVSLGRYPHQKGLLKMLSKQDWNVIENVMELTNITELQDTPFPLLSGGQKQRVLLAKALAQEPEILLLDEPTNHLDIKYTFQMLDLLKEQQITANLTIFAILHDLNIASVYADKIALLHQGRILEVGDVNTLRKKDKLKKVYEVDVAVQSHPTLPKPQLLLAPSRATANIQTSFAELYKIRQTNDYIHVHFLQPLRTISNGVVGAGIHWLTDFCNFHVDKNYMGEDPEQDMRELLKLHNIPEEQAVGLMTAVNMEDAVIIEQTFENIRALAIVTAGVGNAVDITNTQHAQTKQTVGTINTMLFLDAHFTDSALINGIMSATEAKVKALHDLRILDEQSKTIATGTSTDAIVLALTQNGKQTSYAGSGTSVGKAIGQAVYKATTQALQNYLQRLNKRK